MKYRRPVSSDLRYRNDPFPHDTGPDERWQHSGRLYQITSRAGVLAVQASEECVIDVLLFQGHLTEVQHKAALRFRGDYFDAGLMPHLTASYSAVRVSGAYFVRASGRSDEQEDAYSRWREAIAALDLLFRDSVITVACLDITPNRVHLMPVQAGLFQLAKWYGIKREGEASDNHVDQTAARKSLASSHRGCCKVVRGGRLLH